MWFGSIIPDGWAICDGTNSTPDLRGRVPIGVGQGSDLTQRNLGDTGGEETHILSVDEMPTHTHNVDISFSNNGINIAGTSDVAVPGGATSTSTTGGDAGHNNMQPFVALNFIMKIS